jgi:hypothetical protein
VEQQKQWGILFCHILILRIPIECWKKKNTRKRNEDNVMDGSQMFEFLDGRWYSTCMARQKRTATPPEEEKKCPAKYARTFSTGSRFGLRPYLIYTAKDACTTLSVGGLITA